jgi:hypothetical protein
MSVARKLVRSSDSEAGTGAASQEKPPRTWAGRGKGTRCDHCHQPIEADQIEYEVELTADERLQTVSLHFECYEEWILLHPPSGERPPKPDDKGP